MSGPSTAALRIALPTAVTMVAFAANSLLCRAALRDSGIDAASFTTLRVVSAAATLALIVRLRGGSLRSGDWPSAIALFAYAAGFSFAYGGLTAATGALLLFGAVQATMIGRALVVGERLAAGQLVGLVIALGGLIGLLLPGLAAPPLTSALLMLAAGVAWGVYSLRGRTAGPALEVTAGNFLRAVPLALLVSVVMIGDTSIDVRGVGHALASGALASGIGYAIWYTVLPSLRATTAATVQLSVPVIATLGGFVMLDEAVNARVVLASVAVLGGIALAIAARSPGSDPR